MELVKVVYQSGRSGFVCNCDTVTNADDNAQPISCLDSSSVYYSNNNVSFIDDRTDIDIGNGLFTCLPY
jgi:hypothetical protein